MRQRYAGMASVKSSKSISVTAITIKNPTKISAGAVAKPGMAMNTGDKKMDTRNTRSSIFELFCRTKTPNKGKMLTT